MIETPYFAYTAKRSYYNSPSATTAVAFWTSTATAKPVLTDYMISVAAAGTVQIKFGNDASSSVIFEHVMAGSANVVVNLVTPFVGDRNGGKFYMETGANGVAVINATGYEI